MCGCAENSARFNLWEIYSVETKSFCNSPKHHPNAPVSGEVVNVPCRSTVAVGRPVRRAPPVAGALGRAPSPPSPSAGRASSVEQGWGGRDPGPTGTIAASPVSMRRAGGGRRDAAACGTVQTAAGAGARSRGGWRRVEEGSGCGLGRGRCRAGGRLMRDSGRAVGVA